MALSLLGGTGPPSLAESTPIYRCGNTYSQWPCSNAQTVVVDAAPTAAEQRGSARTAALQARWADRLQADRVAADRRNRPALAGSLGPVSPAVMPRARRQPARQKDRAARTAGNGDFIAYVPAPPKRRSAPK